MSITPLFLDYDYSNNKLVQDSYCWCDIPLAFANLVHLGPHQNFPKEKTLPQSLQFLDEGKLARSLRFLNEARLPRENFSESELLDWVRSWANALNNVCFFGSLMEYIEIEFSRLEPLDEPKALGCWNWEKKTVFLNPYNHHGKEGWNVQDSRCIVDLISTLVHEMMHAFFNVFCSGDIDAISPCVGGLGSDGHGPPWADAMATVQGVLNHLLPFRIDCEIYDSVQRSMGQYGWWATKEDMKRWGASQFDLDYWKGVELRRYESQHPHLPSSVPLRVVSETLISKSPEPSAPRSST